LVSPNYSPFRNFELKFIHPGAFVTFVFIKVKRPLKDELFRLEFVELKLSHIFALGDHFLYRITKLLVNRSKNLNALFWF